MANLKQTAIEFIKETFSPTIAVCCSSDAVEVCAKNNLSFSDMVNPFCKLSNKVEIRDVGNISHTIIDLKLILKDINERNPQPTIIRKLLQDVVTASSQSYFLSTGMNFEPSNDTPWFESYRETFLKCCDNFDHESIKNFLACIFVVSSSCSNIIEEFNTLSRKQQVNQNDSKQSKWFDKIVLRYYVLLHDASSPHLDRAEQMIGHMRETFGRSFCHLLIVNSKNPTDNPNDTAYNYWSQNSIIHSKNKSEENTQVESIPEKINSHPLESNRESPDLEIPQPSIPLSFSLGSLRNLTISRQSLNDLQDISNNVSSNAIYGTYLSSSDYENIRSFLEDFTCKALIPYVERTIQSLNEQVSSKKRGFWKLFTSQNKPTTVGNWNDSGGANVVYTSVAPEMMVRRLADLAFMFQLYDLAFNMYNTAKRNFNSDQAWLYFAGAVEMSELSLFLSGKTPSLKHLENALNTYSYTCRHSVLTTRCLFLLTEVLKHEKWYTDAANQFVKIISEDSDLCSALLLEQAANCYKNNGGQMRKYAFHMILSGHRFSKAGQKQHALRAYCQTLRVYENKNWNLAEDHINFTIGRQCFNLKYLEKSCESFKCLLSTYSKQTPPQQASFLREYLYVLNLANKGSTSPPLLSFPLIKHESILLFLPICNGKLDKLDCVHHTFDNRQLFCDLEQIAIGNDRNQTEFCYSSNKIRQRIICYVDEEIGFEITFKKILKVQFNLTDISLLWKLTSKDGEVLSYNNDETIADIEFVKSFHMALAETEKSLLLKIRPKLEGTLDIIGISYCLSCNVSNQQQPVEVYGQQMFDTLLTPNIYSLDVIDNAPLIEFTTNDFSTNLYNGQIVEIILKFKNIGSSSLKCGKLILDKSDFLIINSKTLIAKNSADLFGNLNCGEEVIINAFMKAPDQLNTFTGNLLFLFFSINDTYRTLRKSINLNIKPSLKISGREAKSDCDNNISRIVEIFLENQAENSISLSKLKCLNGYMIDVIGNVSEIDQIKLEKSESQIFYLKIDRSKTVDFDNQLCFFGIHNNNTTVFSIFWKVDDNEKIYGQTNILLDMEFILSPSINNKQHLINYKFIYEQKIDHNFNSINGRLCRVPINLVLENRHDKDIEIIVDAQNEFQLVSGTRINNSLNFLWTKQIYHSGIIKAFATFNCEMMAVFSRGGRYNLSNIKINAKPLGDTTFHKQSTTIPYFIFVGDIHLLYE